MQVTCLRSPARHKTVLRTLASTANCEMGGDVICRSDLAATLVRLHCCPTILLRVGSQVASFQRRSIGLYTGSRSAAAAGRIPLLDAASDRLPTWTEKCFSQNGCHCALATFVDNLVTAGTSPENAIEVMEDCAAALASKWHLSMGNDSKEFMVCRGYPLEINVPNDWQQRQTMKMLGHSLDDDAGIASCFAHVSSAMLRCFYGNLDHGLRRASPKAKYRFLRTSVQSVAQFRWARWPYQVTYAKKLDGLQRKMLSILFQIVPRPEEPYDAFVQRRHAHSGPNVGDGAKLGHHPSLLGTTICCAGMIPAHGVPYYLRGMGMDGCSNSAHRILH